ncbi:MAG: alpha/beta hydrolase [Beijerinckiaceae bacterium]|nr:alpha/beta hydrolase [Beijerinckiaceae bacterium]
MSTNERKKTSVKLGGVTLEVERRGSGRPLLLLLGEEHLELDAPFVDELAKSFEVIIPSAPGFGHSERPDWITGPDHIAYMYLDLIDTLSLKDVTVVGFSLGGWIAAELATKNNGAISKLVLVDAYGVKIGGPTDRDIMDIWTSNPTKVAAAKWADPAKGERDFTKMSDDELTIVARNIESFARFCWEPYMHNPKLKQRLHLIKVPTLLIWGEKDGIVETRYGEAYGKLIPGSRFAVVPGAGHYPHLEAPQAFMTTLRGFIG